MKNILKIILLIITLLPVIYIIFFITSFGNRDLIFDNFYLIFKIHGMTMGLIVVLMVTYIVLLFKNKTIAEAKRTQWLLLILLGNIIAMPFYWFIYLKPGRSIKNTDVSSE